MIITKNNRDDEQEFIQGIGSMNILNNCIAMDVVPPSPVNVFSNLMAMEVFCQCSRRWICCIQKM